MNLHKRVFNKAEPGGIHVKVEPLFSVEQRTGNSDEQQKKLQHETRWTRASRALDPPPPPPTKGCALVRFCGGAGESGDKWTGVEKQVLAKDLVVLAGEVDEDGLQMADMKWRVGKGKKVKVEKWRCVVLEWQSAGQGQCHAPAEAPAITGARPAHHRLRQPSHPPPPPPPQALQAKYV